MSDPALCPADSTAELQSNGSTKKVVVPGARAPSVKVPGLLNSMPRLLLKHGSKLRSFFASFLSNKPQLRDGATSQRPLWPLPVPYPELFEAGSLGRFSWRKRRTAFQVVLLNWLHLGRPVVCPDELWPGRKLSRRQWSRVRLLEDLCEDGNSIFELDAGDMARAAAKTEASCDVLESLHRAWSSVSHACDGKASGTATCASVTRFGGQFSSAPSFGQFIGKGDTDPFVTAKLIEASRVSFVGVPSFDPVEFFDDTTRRAYCSPLECRLDAPLGEVPKVAVHASLRERNELFKKMAECGRLRYVCEKDVDPRYLSGLFAVPKDLQKDRLILDARPANCMEPTLCNYVKTMAGANVLSQLELADDEVLLLSGRDIRDYFYQFKVTEQRSRRNVLAAKLSADDLQYIFGRAFPGPGFVGLSTLAMGDNNACEFAQGSHVALVLQCGGASKDELIQMHSPLPRSPYMLGIVIDDLVCLERVLLSSLEPELRPPTTAAKRLKLIMKQYDKVGLPTNEKKSFDDAVLGSFWGVSLDGSKGTLRPNQQRLWPLVLVTLRVICLGVVTVALLRSIIGSFISVLMVRRRFLSGMNLCFDAVSASSSDDEVLRLSGDLKDELFVLICLGSIAVVNLRAATLGTVRASDASDWGMAAVSCEVPRRVAMELMRHSLSKSTWSRLLPPGKAWLRAKRLLDPEEELPDGECFDVHPLWEVVSRSLSYKEEWRLQHRKPVHINVGELRAHLREEARLGQRHCSVRVPYCLDSQVSLGCLVKGRSASKALNAELMKSIPVVATSDLYGGYGYVPSKLNRADAPTRDAEVPGPDMALPPWWAKLCDGFYSDFDAWIAEAEHGLQGAESLDSSAQDTSDRGEKLKLMTGKQEFLKRGENAAPSCRTTTGVSSSKLSLEAITLLQSFNAKQFYFGSQVTSFEEPGALDLFSGKAGVARALIRLGCPWVLSFEINRSSAEDLTLESNRSRILQLVKLKAFKLCGSAMVCKSFSVAITPPVRSNQYPRGLPNMSPAMREKVSEGNSMADFQSELMDVCHDNSCFSWLENPDSSFVWRQKKFEKYRSAQSGDVMRVDYCRFGTPWRKRTKVATDIPKLKGMRMLCVCKKPHVRLRGQHPTLKVPWTLVAQPYPRAFSKLIAAAACDAVGWSQRFDIGECAKAGSLRVGEASNPGPARARGPRGFSLEGAPVQTFTSLALGDRRWELFLTWCRERLSGDPLSLFLTVPLFLAHAIRRYGDLDFAAGGSLLYFRHLVLAAQRKVPTLKPYVSICWDLASRWERIEPTQHRAPVPEILVRAMVSVAWHFGWRRWCGITLVCFYGIARAGEVLKCCRQDLLLPCDMMFECGDAFLVLKQSKTSYRGSAKVQHLKISSEQAVKLLTVVFREAHPQERLFCGTAQTFRRRWDFLLQTLRVSCANVITPGGLRGGGAVAHYRSGGSVSDLLWRMRLKSLVTLESYLQEVGALSVLCDLSADSRRSVAAAAALFALLP